MNSQTHYVNFVAVDATPNALTTSIIKKATKNHHKLLHQDIKLPRQYNCFKLNKPLTFLNYTKSRKLIVNYLRLSEWYTYLWTPIVNQVLRLFWGINKLSTTGDSPDMGFGQFQGFLVQLWPKTWVSPTYRPDHKVNPENRSSYGFQDNCYLGVCNNWTITSPLAPSSTDLLELSGKPKS